jgi:hypothetical protein
MLLLEDWRLLLSLEVLLMDIYEDGQKCRHFWEKFFKMQFL